MSGTAGCVLVVEDDEKSSRLMCELFRLRGFDPHPVSTGALAVDAAATLAPSLILMDIQLPDMDGSTVLRTLRASSMTAEIPVVAVTALAMEGDRERLLADGFDGYLSKPIDVATLVDSVIPLMRSDPA
ncbi:MAG TPA: response regulator [Mycobacteriales bacterium]|jgi:CheY-like chemotaxis protein|nr:response regulator [Mycobacteriales bacterium]